MKSHIIILCNFREEVVILKGKSSRIIYGVLLMTAGILAIGNQLDLWNVSVFFPGWWTLFIIIPFLSDIIESGVRPWNLAGLSVGIVLLLSELRIVTWKLIVNTVVPILAIVIGLFLIVSKKK